MNTDQHESQQVQIAPVSNGEPIFDFRPAVWLCFGLYAVLLSLVAFKHEMWRDELQAWLIARDSHSLRGLFVNNRYEGHPLLWPVLLFVLAHFTPNPFVMKLLNLSFAWMNGFIVLFTRQFRLLVRCAFAFSYFYFFEYGVLSRDYMIGVLLLSAAAVLLTLRPRNRLAPLLLLVLAIQTSLFAMPIAAYLFLVYYARPGPNVERKVLGIELSTGNVLSGILLLASAVFALFTMHPPANTGVVLVPETRFSAYRVALYNVAFAYFPLPARTLTFWNSDLLGKLPHWNFTVLPLSLLILILVFLGLQTTRARAFFALSTLSLIQLYEITTRNFMRHIGFLVVVFFLALFLDAVERRDNLLSPLKSFRWFISLVLLVQVFAAAFASIESREHVFSAGKETAEYLERAGLANNPLLVNPDTASASILGYLERPQAFYLHGMRFGSFVIWDKDYLNHQTITEAGMRAAQNGSTQPLIVVTADPLSAPAAQGLHLIPLANFKGTIVPDESLYVYEAR